MQLRLRFLYLPVSRRMCVVSVSGWVSEPFGSAALPAFSGMVVSILVFSSLDVWAWSVLMALLCFVTRLLTYWWMCEADL